ncbi:4-azaleucine resistance transporter AzlC [Pseudogracilibacillus auburnensis]|uniref:4-azaleucine resistance transporter AzlC n=2 Tax=Pseudogracilibacillus auburnensis TaxID=1494959 RepID=A0A2V3VYB1_9BACI|nr:4-azaleucine resistance transporter AzlC [Pseudogracilibacillus auburnensis]
MRQASKRQGDSQSMYMIQKGIQVGFPIILGYIPVALTYGVLASQSGMSLLDLTLMSALVYAGASQFMGVNMMAASASAIEIVVATFVLNFRHFIMSLSFMNEIRDRVSLKGRVGLSLGLTDETFAVASMNKEKAEEEKGVFFYATIYMAAYLSWVIGSFVGGLLGEVIPERLSQSMGIALYAMFIGLLIPSVKKEIKFGFIAIIAMLINVIANQFVSSGWAIVLGTVFGGLTGVYFLKEKQQ